MMHLSVAGAMLGVPHQGADAEFVAVGSDTRAVSPGMLFVALKGERFDGHDFVIEALAKGAAGALVEATFARAHPELPLLPVLDTRVALGQLAAAWRSRHCLPVIGVVGSNGKTTAKEMCAAILRAHHGAAAVLATTGNLNNDIGLPMMALRLTAAHRAAVLEIGMNHPGETTALAAVAQPTVALVNNAQREHQEFMASVAAVAAEHAILIDALAADGVAVFNADDAHAALWRRHAGARRALGFGLAAGEVRGAYAPSATGGELRLATPWGSIECTLGVPGEHNARNACGAAAACLAAGVAPAAVVAGLADFKSVKGRLQPKSGRGGARLIDDSYNANPDSVRAAIDVLASLPGRRVLVLGDMGEVGDQGPQMHAEVGDYARARGIERLLCVGDAMRAAGGEHFADIEALVVALEAELGAQTTLLVKGSRFMRMERVVERIAEEHSAT